MGSLEREYPILGEDRRRKSSKNKNIKALLYLGGALVGIAIKVIFFS